MPDITLSLFGSPVIHRAGQRVEMDTRKATALLAYLVVTGSSISRDTAAALLWPEYSQSNARAALRRTLSVMRKALGDDILDASREYVMLAKPDMVRCDVVEFTGLLRRCKAHIHPAISSCPECVPALEQAEALYRGDFLAGFGLRDSAAFDDWQYFQAEGLRQDLAWTLERLVQTNLERGSFESAIGYARRWLALDPLREEAHRWLMQLYFWTGQRNTALRQFSELRRILEDELGIEPLEETAEIYRQIKENRLPMSTGRVGQEKSPAPVSGDAGGLAELSSDLAPLVPLSRSYPLVGRSKELAQLGRSYTRAGRGHGCLIVLEGEAGIGKTRLADEFLGQVRAGGARVHTAAFYSRETHLAYSAFAEILRNTLRSEPQPDWVNRLSAPARSDAARLVPELTDRLERAMVRAPDVTGAAAQTRFFNSLQETLLSITTPPRAMPGVLFFDDVQWADEASLELLAYLAHRLSGWPVCLLLAWRSEEVPEGHHLRRMLTDGQRAQLAAHIRLDRFRISEVAQLVKAALPASGATDRLARRLYQETEGNPFFLVEYLAALSQNGEGLDSPDWELPASIRDLLLSRLHAVDEAGRQVLQTAAVIGRSFDYDSLREVSGRSDEEAVVALEKLVAAGLVHEVQPAGPDAEMGDLLLNYDFSHEKVRALVYEEISQARRRLLHRRVAEVLIGRSLRGQPLLARAGQIAVHYRQAGQPVEAGRYYRLAGEYARSLFAYGDALLHFEAALSLGHPDPAGLERQIGELLTMRGEYRGALAHLSKAASLLSCERDHGPDLVELERLMADVYDRLGDWGEAEDLLRQASERLEETSDSQGRAGIFAAWSRIVYHQGNIVRAQELALQALELARPAGDLKVQAQAHNLLGILARRTGSLEAAIENLQASLALAQQMNDIQARIAAGNNLARVYADLGDLNVALPLVQEALVECRRIGDRHREAALLNNLAELFHNAGKGEEAMQALKDAVRIFADIGNEAGSPQPEIWKLTEW